MGYDVSFHPISPEEMQEWYFTPLTWIQQGQEEKVLALAAQHGIEDFYANKYLDTLRVGSETDANELFDKSHGFYLAVILSCRTKFRLYTVLYSLETDNSSSLSKSCKKSDRRKLLFRRVSVSQSGYADSSGY